MRTDARKSPAAPSSSAPPPWRRPRARPRLPVRPAVVRAADGSPEINAWVVIRPTTPSSSASRAPRWARARSPASRSSSPKSSSATGGRSPRVSDAGPERRAQARVGRLLDRRQPRHPHLARLRAQGRRGRAHDAGAGSGRRVEGPGRGVHRGQQRDHARAVQAQDDLRQGRRGRRQARAAQGRAAEGSEGAGRSSASRSSASTRRQGDRQAGLRLRPQAARHAERGDQGLPGVRRQDQELRRRPRSPA